MKELQNKYNDENEKYDKLEFQLMKVQQEYDTYKKTHSQSNEEVEKVSLVCLFRMINIYLSYYIMIITNMF